MNTLTNSHPIFTLSNRLSMPALGLGVLKATNGPEVEGAVLHALNAGYRHIDTAAAYQNEAGVGRALTKSTIPREEIFLTTKVWNSEQGYEKTLKAFENSLKLLQTDYLDLYLVHWPVAGKYKDTWRALEKLYDEGKVKAIGVSNFQVHHLEDLRRSAQIMPMVNQIEMHPHLQQEELRAYSAKHQIQLEAWRPIMMGKVQELQALQEIAKKYGKGAVQVSLRWLYQLGVSAIPKSVNPIRIQQNADIFDFELNSAEMAIIGSLNQNRRLGPDPDNFNF